jgi:hypothetical protein
MIVKEFVIRVADSQENFDLVTGMIAKANGYRIADYGIDRECADAPLWIKAAQLVDIDKYSAGQQERWYACGRTDL